MSIFGDHFCVTDEKVFDVVLNAHVTEKSTLGAQYNHYTFKVHPASTKLQIAHAIKKLFKVEVESVNTLNRKGKQKRFRGRSGRRKDEKLAIVKVKKGYTIDYGVEVK